MILHNELYFYILQAVGVGQSGRKVSFPYFMAFNSLLNNMELIKRIYLNATNGHRYQEVTKGILKKIYSKEKMINKCTY